MIIKMIPVTILYLIIAILSIAVGYTFYKYSEEKKKNKETTSTTNKTSALTTNTTTTSTTTFPPSAPTFYQYPNYEGKSYTVSPLDYNISRTKDYILDKMGLDKTKVDDIIASVYIPSNFQVNIYSTSNVNNLFVNSVTNLLTKPVSSRDNNSLAYNIDSIVVTKL